MESKSINLKCSNKKCLYIWPYKGQATGPYTSCPKCKYNVNIKKCTMIEKEAENEENQNNNNKV